MSGSVRDFAILGLGTSLPPHAMTQAEAVALAQQVCCQDEDQARLLRVLYRRAGVNTRYTAVPHRAALEYLPPENDGDVRVAVLGPTTAERMAMYRHAAAPLAIEAARQALERSETAPQRIAQLVTVSCTGFAAPGVDAALIAALGLRPTVERTHVGFMGCHGAINGLRAARGLACLQPEARVLLCAVELCSLHYRFQWDPERFIGNVIFGDGAAALVGGAGASEDDWRVVASGSCLLPDSLDAMRWDLGDHGFEMFLSPRVPDLIHQHLRPWLEGWLREQGLELEHVGSWAVHPGGPRILRAVEEALALPAGTTAVSREVLAECGNMSSPTVLFILDRLRQREAPRPCVLLGFGPGLVAEAALLR